MNRHGFLFAVVVILLGGLLFGCMGPILTPEPTPTVQQPVDYSLYGTANYVSGSFQNDPFPLFVGARWIYHNAATYWNPQIASSGLLESEVVAIVQGNGEECYVLRTHYSNGPDELLYVHRSPSAVLMRGATLLTSPGAQSSYSLNPGLAFLEFPLAEDKTWDSTYSGGSVAATVYHKEVVAIESGQVNTMLGTYSPIFVGAWRIHYDLVGSGPRLFGGPTQFLWFAPGVGIVKHVLNSIDYELAEFRLPDEVRALDENDAAGSSDVPEGGLVVVQLRGGDPDVAKGWGWRLAGGTDSVLDPIGNDFYDDVPQVAKQSGAGTYVYQFRAQDIGTTTLQFELISLETGIVGDTAEFTIHVE